MNNISDKTINLIIICTEILSCLVAYVITRSPLVCNILTFSMIFNSWLRSILSKKIKFNGFTNWAYMSSLALVGISILYNDIMYLKLRFTLVVLALMFVLIFYPIYHPKDRTFTQKFLFDNFPSLKQHFSAKKIRELDISAQIFCIVILITNIIIMLAYSSEVWMIFKTIVFPILVVLFILTELLLSGYMPIIVKLFFRKLNNFVKKIFASLSNLI